MESAIPNLSLPHYLTIDIRRTGESTRLNLQGELDLASAEALATALASVELESCGPIVIDMEQVTFLDCSGLSVLLGVYNRACRDDRDLFITNPQESVRRIFVLTGCKHLLAGSDSKASLDISAPA